MAIQNTLGLGIAVLLHRRARSRRLLQTLYAMPYLVIPIVIGKPVDAAALAHLRAGQRVVAQGRPGLPGSPWLGEPSTALWVVVLVSAWQWVGFPVLCMACAWRVPEELSEAARVDGASHWQTF